MKRLLTNWLAVLIVVTAVPRAADAQVYPERLGADGVLALGNISGDITIGRAGGADTTIDVVKTARARTPEDARQMLKLVTVEIGERNGRADVRAHYPGGGEQGWSGRRNVNVSVAYT